MKLWVCCYAYVSELHLYVLFQLEDQHVLAVLCLVPGHCLYTTAKTISIPHSLSLPPKCANRYEMSSTADSFYRKHMAVWQHSNKVRCITSTRSDHFWLRVIPRRLYNIVTRIEILFCFTPHGIKGSKREGRNSTWPCWHTQLFGVKQWWPLSFERSTTILGCLRTRAMQGLQQDHKKRERKSCYLWLLQSQNALMLLSFAHASSWSSRVVIPADERILELSDIAPVQKEHE